MTPVRTALVIGGGIAGPATAMALQKAGIEASVHEAHAGGADGTGAFLTLASNGIDALRVLGADGPALAAGFPTPHIALRSVTGKHLGDASTGGTLSDGTTSHTLRRADLYRVLHDEARARGVEVRRGSRLVAAEDTGDGVLARFDDGSEATADVLIGCDGINSTVRRIVDPGAPAPAYAGLLNTGGFARGVTVDAAPGTYEMTFGRRAFFGHVVAPDGEVWWFANVPSGTPEPAFRDDQRWRAHLLDLYAGDAGPALALIEATTDLAAIGPVHTVPHLPVWHRGRMVVAGDAAHAPSPTSGQGASLSIEDALVLAICLRDEPDAATAFAAFEARRRPRVEKIIKAAARMNSAKAAGPVGRVLRDAMMPTIMKLTANSKALREVHDFHVEWDSRTAVPA